MSHSALETDLNPNTYIGLSFPLRRDKFNDFAMTKNLLLTFPGERVGQPVFGCRLRELCFEQQDDELPGRIEEEIKQAVSSWLPYINIQEVNTLTEEGDLNKIFVEVKFSTTLNPQTQVAITVDASYSAERF
jgi:phage baseplate assembly protein W